MQPWPMLPWPSSQSTSRRSATVTWASPIVGNSLLRERAARRLTGFDRIIVTPCCSTLGPRSTVLPSRAKTVMRWTWGASCSALASSASLRALVRSWRCWTAMRRRSWRRCSRRTACGVGGDACDAVGAGMGAVSVIIGASAQVQAMLPVAQRIKCHLACCGHVEVVRLQVVRHQPAPAPQAGCPASRMHRRWCRRIAAHRCHPASVPDRLYARAWPSHRPMDRWWSVQSLLVQSFHFVDFRALTPFDFAPDVPDALLQILDWRSLQIAAPQVFHGHGNAGSLVFDDVDALD